MIASMMKRGVNFVRPRARRIPIDVSEILRHQAASELTARFNDLYYMLGIADRMSWRGVKITKNPCDLWVVADLISRIQPAVIVETGTAEGGSALFYADIARLNALPMKVITVDVKPKISFSCEGLEITSLTGYSTSSGIVNKIRALVGESAPAMVILDSDHGRENVARELELYSSLVTVGSYLIVEDTNVNGHPSFAAHGPGPYEAVEGFLSRTSQFVIDRECEQHLLTFNPCGYLRRVG
jgi:cephalosporin hydroxylase